MKMTRQFEGGEDLVNNIGRLMNKESYGRCQKLKIEEKVGSFNHNFRLVKLVSTVSETEISNTDSGQMFKKRVTISPNARHFLNRAFNLQPYPNRRERELLAEKCKLTPIQVRVWVS